MTKHRLRRLGLLLIAMIGPSAFAQSTSMEDRLQRLESEVTALRTENQKLRSDLGLEGKAGQTTIRPAGRAPTVSVGGLVQVQSEFGDKGDARFTTGNDRVYLRRARINIQGRFLEEFDFKVEGEFGNALAETTGARAQLTDGFINWNKYVGANVKVGQFKTPFGYEQLAADPRLFTIERTLANDRLTVSRQIGLQIGGDLLDRKLTYAVGGFNGTGVNTNANDNDQFMWVGRVNGTAWAGNLGGMDSRWTVGTSALSSTDANLSGQPTEFGFDSIAGGARDNIFAGRRTAWSADSQFHLGRLDVWTEYLRATFKPTNAIPASRFDSDGGYVQAAWFAVPTYLQAVLKYDVFDPNLSAGSNRTRTWTIGANYFFKSDDLKLQVDYLSSRIDGNTKTNGKLLMRFQSIF